MEQALIWINNLEAVMGKKECVRVSWKPRPYQGTVLEIVVIGILFILEAFGKKLGVWRLRENNKQKFSV